MSNPVPLSESAQTHFDLLLDLLDVEREAEKQENLRELEKYPLAVRETLGKTVTRLVIVDDDVGVGGLPLLILSKHATSSELSPFHAMDQGDVVRLTYPPGSGLPSIDGTLYDVDDFRVSVAINGPIPNPIPSGPCQLDMLGSDATYKRMRQALNQLKKSGKPDLIRLRQICMGEQPASFDQGDVVPLFNSTLNEFQALAVQKCLSAQDVAVVHGPPGTGKTTVLVEIIRQAVKRGERVLASAPSNIAVDNMVEKLLPHSLRIVRLGHPARTLEALRHVTLTAQLEDSGVYRDIRMMDDERHRLITQKRRKQDRGLGLSYDERKDMEKYIDDLWKAARDLEFATKRQIIDHAQVVLSTHGSVGGQLAKQRFDLVVMDEASQSTEPLSWIPMILGKKVVFAGDSNQLPPTVYSKEASKKGLSVTLFDRLKKLLPDDLQTLLRIQYRMHETIMGFSSEQFYEGQLIADESVRCHTANELPMVKSTELTESPMMFIDTAGTGYEETWNELLESRENEGEAQLILKVLGQLKESGIQNHKIAVITPYVAQVKKLKMLLPYRDLEIGSIDGFQGREKEVVILSLVRSNEKGEVGFLSDVRRMNVGMTRARRLLVVIGDSSTISQHPFYHKFLDYVEAHNAHRSAWEWKDL